MIGRVVSTKMQKTAVVLISRRKKHPLYGKTFVRTKKYLADDPLGVKDGDMVILEKVRPISKRKHWQIKKVMGRDIVALGEEVLKQEAKKAIAQVLPEEEGEEEEARIKSQESSKGETKEQKVDEINKKTVKNEKKSRTGRSGNGSTSSP